MNNTPTPKENCETCHGLGRVDAVYAHCPNCVLTAAREEIKELNDKLDDAVADATNAVNDIIRMKWQRDRLAEELTTTRQAHESIDLLIAELAAATEQRNEYKAALQSADNHNHEIATKLEIVTEQRDEWKAKFIQQNKDLGCEMMDPNGTIWDYAKKLQTQLPTITKQRDKLADALLELRNNNSLSLGGAAYEIVEQALQSLNPDHTVAANDMIADVKGGSNEIPR